MTRLTNDLTDAFVIGMFAAALVFVGRYTKIAPWWRHLAGKAMVSLDVANAIILIPSLLLLIFHIHVNTDFFAWYRVCSLAVGFGIIVWRIWTVGHVNAEVETRKAPAEEPPAEKNTTEEGVNDAVCQE